MDRRCDLLYATENGAPINGDQNECQTRLSKGMDVLLGNARQGLNNMPPKGACNDCTDAGLKLAIEAIIGDQ